MPFGQHGLSGFVLFFFFFLNSFDSNLFSHSWLLSIISPTTLPCATMLTLVHHTYLWLMKENPSFLPLVASGRIPSSKSRMNAIHKEKITISPRQNIEFCWDFPEDGCDLSWVVTKPFNSFLSSCLSFLVAASLIHLPSVFSGVDSLLLFSLPLNNKSEH